MRITPFGVIHTNDTTHKNFVISFIVQQSQQNSTECNEEPNLNDQLKKLCQFKQRTI